MRATWLAFTLSAGLGLGACNGADDESAGSTATTTASGSSGSSSGASSSGASSSGGAETTGEDTTGGPPLMVMCEGVACLRGQLCVSPPSVCNYDKMPPEVEQGPASCADYPPPCIGETAEMERECLSGTFCAGSVGPASYDGAGTLDCFPAWYDCF